MSGRSRDLHRSLEGYLRSRIPGSRLAETRLPQAPELSLCLIGDDYPRHGLPHDQSQALMNDPPYWCFCWASGQVLGRYLLDHPERVRGRTLVDFGAGSGVVGIAAGVAGARRVILCDRDERALLAGELNARMNGVGVEFSPALEEILAGDCGAWIVAAADVFYDWENLPLLETLLQRFATVLVSDSRLGGRALPGMKTLGRCECRTVPDLDEHLEFNRVTLYGSAGTSAPK